MSTQEFQLQVLLESLHSLHPASLTSEQMIRALGAMRFATARWEDELRRRELAESTRALADYIVEGV